jgi:hypothetical protein
MFKFILLFVISFNCFALDGEFSIGETVFQKQENGYWYQDGFQHTLNMESPSVALGITDKFYNHFRYHMGYRYLGHVSTIAQCMGSDALYAVYQKTGNNPLKLGTYYGNGSVNQLYFTAGPEFNFGDWHTGIEGGLIVYQATWSEQGIGFQTAVGATPISYNWGAQSHIFTGGTIGISAGYKNTEAILSVYDVNGKDYVWSVYHGLATNLSIRFMF